MSAILEEIAHAASAERVRQAHAQRAAHHLARSRRWQRKADRAADQADIALGVHREQRI